MSVLDAGTSAEAEAGCSSQGGLALLARDPVALREAIVLGSDINEKYSNALSPSWGQTTLLVAALSGYGASVACLLELNADIDARDPFKRNALHLAALNGHTSVASSLLDAAVNIDAVDAGGSTALQAMPLLSAAPDCCHSMRSWATTRPLSTY